MIEGKRIHLTKYLNPVTITTAVASEVGLPVIGTTIAPTIVYTEGKVKLTVEGQSNPTFYELVTSKKIDLDVEVKHKFVTKATTILRALVPWTQRAVATGIDSERQVNLPIKARLEVSRKEVDKYVKFTVTPTQSTQIPILYARNVPFTAFKSMWQNEDMIKSGDFKPLYVDLMKKQPLNHIEREFGMDLTGLKMKAIWDGDVDYPFQLGDIYEFFKRPERLFTTALGVDARQWRYGIFIDPSSSKTKQINLKASIIPSGNDAGAPVKEPISVEDSNVKRYQKTKAMIEGTNFENFGAARVELAFTGSENRKYDAGMSWYTNPTAQLEKTKIIAYALRTQLPLYSPSPKSICVLL